MSSFLCCVVDHFADDGKIVCFRGVTKMYANEQHTGDAAGMVWQLKCCARRVLHGQGFGMLPNKFLHSKRALYRQRHCLQPLFLGRTNPHILEFVHTICAGVCRVVKLSHDRSSTGVRARYRVKKLPKGTRTLEQSLVCYTSPGGVASSGFVRGSRLGRCSGWRSK